MIRVATVLDETDAIFRLSGGGSTDVIRKIISLNDVRGENGTSGAQHWPIGVTW